MIFASGFVWCAIAFSPFLSIVSTAAQAITPEISSLAQSIVASGVPGLTVGVVRLSQDGTVSTEYGAWGNRTEDGDPARPDTLFDLGSVSKAFLATALGILMDDFASGKNVTALPDGLATFSWDTKIQALFPGDDVWKLEDEWASQKANIRDLLGHVTGISRNELMYTRQDSPLAVGQRLRFLKPSFELREEWSYCNIMYFFGSHIVTTFAGKPFQDFVEERIFTPLNMTSSTYSLQDAQSRGLVSQAWTSFGRRIPNILEDENVGNLIAGAGGIISTAVDMSKWAATVLNGGVDPVTNTTIFSQSVYVETTSAREIESGTPPDPRFSIVGYGSGWERMTYKGHDLISHEGDVPGFASIMRVFPDDGIAIFSSINSDGPSGVQDILPFAIFDSLVGLPPTTPDLPATAPTVPDDTSATNCSAAAALVPIDRYAGTYFNPGYGNLTFCAPSGGADAFAASAYCQGALADFAALNPSGAPDAEGVYAVTARLVTHVSMRRDCSATGGDDNGDGAQETETFVLELQSIYPQGYGRDTSPFTEMYGGATAECVVDSAAQTVVGCGWLGIEPGNNKVTVGTVQERADVWFEKL